MSSNARVLTGLIERRALETAFTELAQTSNAEDLAERARAIAAHGSAAVLPVLVSLLDTIDPQLRGGLGQVAAALDREPVVQALRAAARGRDRSDQARLTALMVLDRYLHEPVDEALLLGLQDPDAVAAQSLRELSHEMAHNPFVVVEYLNQLAEQPAEVAGLVLDAIPQQPPDANLVTLLRMFAQGPNRVIAQRAIDQLSRTRQPAAAAALASLAATLPQDLAALAARGLRKLHMSGISEPAPAIDRPAWRALLSPIDGTGAQVVWFVGQPDAATTGTLFSILCKDPEGIIASFGSDDVAAADLPPRNPLGAQYVIRQAEDAPPITLLEVPLDAGRQVVAAALELMWERHELPPLEYRLLNPLIWDLGPLDQPAEPAAEEYAASAASALLDHPAFATWFWQAAPLYEAAQQLGRRATPAARSILVEALLRAHFDPALVASYQRRLAGMARWLICSGQPEPAALAQAAAQHLADLPPEQVPLLRRLINVGLDVAIANLRSGMDLRHRAA